MAGAAADLRPRRSRQRGADLHLEATNADRAIGQEAQVTEDIDNIHGKGAVVIRGVTWTARSEDGSIIPAGTMVKVLRIEGVKVFVERAAAAAKPETW